MSETVDLEVPACVARGAALMDELAPQWWQPEYIRLYCTPGADHPDGLDLNDYGNCVIGQVTRRHPAFAELMDDVQGDFYRCERFMVNTYARMVGDFRQLVDYTELTRGSVYGFGRSNGLQDLANHLGNPVPPGDLEHYEPLNAEWRRVILARREAAGA